MKTGSAQAAAVLVLMFIAATVAAQDNADDVRIETTELRGGVYMLTGSGGNLAAFAGKDSLILVDDQLAPLTDAIVAALGAISDRPVNYVINTHYHGDHVGGNENFGRAGAAIVAQDQVRQRMSSRQVSEFLNSETPPYPDAALPVITFTETVRFHVNDDHVHVMHVPRAHTDGDSIVHFEQADVLHMGDAFWNGIYPFIDFEAGGSIDGLIAAVEAGLGMAGDETHVIPGHGPLGDRAALEAYRDMLVAARRRVAAARDAGHSLEDVQAAKLTAEWDAQWGGWFIKPEQFVEFIYRTLP